jgi:hypothetical protein
VDTRQTHHHYERSWREWNFSCKQGFARLVILDCNASDAAVKNRYPILPQQHACFNNYHSLNRLNGAGLQLLAWQDRFESAQRTVKSGSQSMCAKRHPG